MIYFNYYKQWTVDENGSKNPIKPSIAFCEKPIWEIQIFEQDTTPYDLSGIATFRCCIDSDYDHATAPMCRSLNESFLTSDRKNGLLKIKLDAMTVQFQQKIGKNKTLAAEFELWGFDSSGEQIFYLKFDVTAKNVIDPDGAVASEVLTNLIDRTYADSVVKRKLIFEYSADGKNWHNEFVPFHDIYQRVRHGIDGEPSDEFLIPYGSDGRSLQPDALGILSERPENPDNNFCFLDTDNGDFYWFIDGSWTPPVHLTTVAGKDGEDGVSIIDMELVKSEGLTDTYRMTLSDTSYFEFDIRNGTPGGKGDKGDTFTFSDLTDADKTELKGEPGEGLHFDVVDVFEKRHIYDAAAAGFSFMATDLYEDEENKYKYQLWYRKKTSDIGDWSAGVRLYCGRQGEKGDPGQRGPDGPPGENAAIIPDVVFTADDIDDINALVIPGIKPIAQIELVINEKGDTIVTNDLLIRVCREENHTILYFNEVDYSLGGRVRFAQGIGGISPYQEYLKNGGTLTFEEFMKLWHSHSNMETLNQFSQVLFNILKNIKLDGADQLCYGDKIFMFQNAEPTPLPDGTQKIYYGYIRDLTSVTGITDEILQKAITDGTMKEVDAHKLDKTSAGIAEEGSCVVVIVPDGYSAAKDDGFGGQMEFNVNNGLANSGANGAALSLNGKAYKVYGEFKINTAEVFIYVNIF